MVGPAGPGVSADGFLHARCDAVLHGRAEVERILSSHKAFTRRWDTSAEELLSIAPQAWESVTKRPFDHSREQPFSYETGPTRRAGGRRTTACRARRAEVTLVCVTRLPTAEARVLDLRA